jgi:hypothetical protein
VREILGVIVPAAISHLMRVVPAVSEKHICSMTTQLLFALGMGVQVVPAGIGVVPPDQFGNWATPGSLVELNTAGAISMNLTAIDIAPFSIASDAITTFWLILLPSTKVILFVWFCVSVCGTVVNDEVTALNSWSGFPRANATVLAPKA